MAQIEKFLVTAGTSLRETIAVIDKNASGIAFVVGADRDLLATITDGDIRRAILAQVDLDSAVACLVQQRRAAPIAAPIATPVPELLRLMHLHSVRQIPLLDPGGRVVDVALLPHLAREQDQKLSGVVMAGGFGTRLRPLTDELPKPMLPVGGRPLLEHIVEQLRDAGVQRVSLTTHYRGEVIENHFGDGSSFGVDIRYTQENQPLGTAGALNMVEDWSGPLLVMNGDILTRVDFRALLSFHNEHAADMTVGVRLYEMKVPYGVVETDGVRVTAISEKPVTRSFINAGIYLLSPAVRDYIPAVQRFDMTDLIARLLEHERRVICFPIHEYWLDVGQMEDYQQATQSLSKGTASQ